jgi:hypothetical protein
MEKPDMTGFIKWCKNERAELLNRLTPLESGSMHIGKRASGGLWEDETPKEIIRLKRNIEELEELIAEYGGAV